MTNWQRRLLILAIAAAVLTWGIVRAYGEQINNPIAGVLPPECSREAIRDTWKREDVKVFERSAKWVREYYESAHQIGKLGSEYVNAKTVIWAVVSPVPGGGYWVQLNMEAPGYMQRYALDVEACRIITNQKWQYKIQQASN